ncbi:MAG: hypothetical protein ACKVQC_07140, partial [Elusimicrobiota bacterium]
MTLLNLFFVKKTKLKLHKAMAFVLSVSVVFSHVLFAHERESQLWEERKKSIQKPLVQLAQLSSGLPQIKSFSKSDPLSPLSLAKKTSSINIPHLTIPFNHGSIHSVSWAKSKSNKNIFYIHDIHENLEAQKHLSQAIRDFISHNTTRMVALEGAFSSLDTRPFLVGLNASLREQAANSMLEENEMSGGFHAALTPPYDQSVHFIGIDDKTHHQENVESFKAASALQSRVMNHLEDLKKSLILKKQKTLNDSLKSLDVVVENYRSKKIDLTTYLQTLRSRFKNNNSRLRGNGGFLNGLSLEQVDKFLTVSKIESELHFKQVEYERALLLEKISQRISAPALNQLMKMTLAYRSGDISTAEFYRYVVSLCKSCHIDLLKMPKMNAYIQYVMQSDEIKPEILFSQIRNLEFQVFENEIENSEEQMLVKQSRDLYLMSKLVRFELTNEEWKEYKSIMMPSPVPLSQIGRGLVRGIDFLPFEKFYREAEIRDERMAGNFLRNVKNIKNKELGTPLSYVLVTGGFHSQGITKRLNEAGYNVISFIPKMTQIETSNGSAYLNSFLREKTPLEKLFKGDRLFLAKEVGTPDQKLNFLTRALSLGILNKVVSTAEASNIFKRILGRLKKPLNANLELFSSSESEVKGRVNLSPETSASFSVKSSNGKIKTSWIYHRHLGWYLAAGTDVLLLMTAAFKSKQVFVWLINVHMVILIGAIVIIFLIAFDRWNRMRPQSAFAFAGEGNLLMAPSFKDALSSVLKDLLVMNMTSGGSNPSHQMPDSFTMTSNDIGSTKDVAEDNTFLSQLRDFDDSDTSKSIYGSYLSILPELLSKAREYLLNPSTKPRSLNPQVNLILGEFFKELEGPNRSEFAPVSNYNQTFLYFISFLNDRYFFKEGLVLISSGSIEITISLNRNNFSLSKIKRNFKDSKYENMPFLILVLDSEKEFSIQDRVYAYLNKYKTPFPIICLNHQALLNAWKRSFPLIQSKNPSHSLEQNIIEFVGWDQIEIFKAILAIAPKPNNPRETEKLIIGLIGLLSSNVHQACESFWFQNKEKVPQLIKDVVTFLSKDFEGKYVKDVPAQVLFGFMVSAFKKNYPSVTHHLNLSVDWVGLYQFLMKDFVPDADHPQLNSAIRELFDRAPKPGSLIAIPQKEIKTISEFDETDSANVTLFEQEKKHFARMFDLFNTRKPVFTDPEQNALMAPYMRNLSSAWTEALTDPAFINGSEIDQKKRFIVILNTTWYMPRGRMLVSPTQDFEDLSIEKFQLVKIRKVKKVTYDNHSPMPFLIIDSAENLTFTGLLTCKTADLRINWVVAYIQETPIMKLLQDNIDKKTENPFAINLPGDNFEKAYLYNLGSAQSMLIDFLLLNYFPSSENKRSLSFALSMIIALTPYPSLELMKAFILSNSASPKLKAELKSLIDFLEDKIPGEGSFLDRFFLHPPADILAAAKLYLKSQNVSESQIPQIKAEWLEIFQYFNSKVNLGDNRERIEQLTKEFVNPPQKPAEKLIPQQAHEIYVNTPNIDKQFDVQEPVLILPSQSGVVSGVLLKSINRYIRPFLKKYAPETDFEIRVDIRKNSITLSYDQKEKRFIVTVPSLDTRDKSEVQKIILDMRNAIYLKYPMLQRDLFVQLQKGEPLYSNDGKYTLGSIKKIIPADNVSHLESMRDYWIGLLGSDSIIVGILIYKYLNDKFGFRRRVFYAPSKEREQQGASISSFVTHYGFVGQLNKPVLYMEPPNAYMTDEIGIETIENVEGPSSSPGVIKITYGQGEDSTVIHLHPNSPDLEFLLLDINNWPSLFDPNIPFPNEEEFRQTPNLKELPSESANRYRKEILIQFIEALYKEQKNISMWDGLLIDLVKAEEAYQSFSDVFDSSDLDLLKFSFFHLTEFKDKRVALPSQADMVDLLKRWGFDAEKIAGERKVSTQTVKGWLEEFVIKDPARNGRIGDMARLLYETNATVGEIKAARDQVHQWLNNNENKRIKELAEILRKNRPSTEELKKLIDVRIKSRDFEVIADDCGVTTEVVGQWVFNTPSELTMLWRDLKPGPEVLKDLIIRFQGDLNLIATACGTLLTTVQAWLGNDPVALGFAEGLQKLKEEGHDLEELLQYLRNHPELISENKQEFWSWFRLHYPEFFIQAAGHYTVNPDLLQFLGPNQNRPFVGIEGLYTFKEVKINGQIVDLKKLETIDVSSQWVKFSVTIKPTSKFRTFKLTHLFARGFDQREIRLIENNGLITVEGRLLITRDNQDDLSQLSFFAGDMITNSKTILRGDVLNLELRFKGGMFTQEEAKTILTLLVQRNSARSLELGKARDRMVETLKRIWMGRFDVDPVEAMSHLEQLDSLAKGNVEMGLVIAALKKEFQEIRDLSPPNFKESVSSRLFSGKAAFYELRKRHEKKNARGVMFHSIDEKRDLLSFSASVVKEGKNIIFVVDPATLPDWKKILDEFETAVPYLDLSDTLEPFDGDLTQGKIIFSSSPQLETIKEQDKANSSSIIFTGGYQIGEKKYSKKIEDFLKNRDDITRIVATSLTSQTDFSGFLRILYFLDRRQMPTDKALLFNPRNPEDVRLLHSLFQDSFIWIDPQNIVRSAKDKSGNSVLFAPQVTFIPINYTLSGAQLENVLIAETNPPSRAKGQSHIPRHHRRTHVANQTGSFASSNSNAKVAALIQFLEDHKGESYVILVEQDETARLLKDLLRDKFPDIGEYKGKKLIDFFLSRQTSAPVLISNYTRWTRTAEIDHPGRKLIYFDPVFRPHDIDVVSYHFKPSNTPQDIQAYYLNGQFPPDVNLGLTPFAQDFFLGTRDYDGRRFEELNKRRQTFLDLLWLQNVDEPEDAVPENLAEWLENVLARLQAPTEEESIEEGEARAAVTISPAIELTATEEDALIRDVMSVLLTDRKVYRPKLSYQKLALLDAQTELTGALLGLWPYQELQPKDQKIDKEAEKLRSQFILTGSQNSSLPKNLTLTHQGDGSYTLDGRSLLEFLSDKNLDADVQTLFKSIQAEFTKALPENNGATLLRNWSDFLFALRSAKYGFENKKKLLRKVYDDFISQGKVIPRPYVELKVTFTFNISEKTQPLTMEKFFNGKIPVELRKVNTKIKKAKEENKLELVENWEKFLSALNQNKILDSGEKTAIILVVFDQWMKDNKAIPVDQDYSTNILLLFGDDFQTEKTPDWMRVLLLYIYNQVPAHAGALKSDFDLEVNRWAIENIHDFWGFADVPGFRHHAQILFKRLEAGRLARKNPGSSFIPYSGVFLPFGFVDGWLGWVITGTIGIVFFYQFIVKPYFQKRREENLKIELNNKIVPSLENPWNEILKTVPVDQDVRSIDGQLQSRLPSMSDEQWTRFLT